MGGEAPPNVEKLAIRQAIFLAAGIFVGQFLSAWYVDDLLNFSTIHMQCLKLLFTCSTMCSCKLKL